MRVLLFAYWFVVRARARYLWRRRRLNIGQFIDATEGMPTWMERSSQTYLAKWWRSALILLYELRGSVRSLLLKLRRDER